MSYTLAWIEAHAVPAEDLRERLLDTLVRAEEAEDSVTEAFDVLNDYGYSLVEAAQGCVKSAEDAEDAKNDAEEKLEGVLEKNAELTEKLEQERDRWKEELGAELATERAALEKQLGALQARVRELETATAPVLAPVAIRSAPAHVAKIIHVNFRPGGGQSALDLYREASKLDDDPATQAEAERLYRCALELDPHLAIARCNLGNIFYRRGNLDAASREYDRAIADDPTCPEAHYNRGYVHMERGNHGASTSYFLTAIKLDPSFADAYVNCGMALEQIGDPHTAQWHWKKYLEIEPHGTHAALARSHLLPETPQRRPRKPRAVKGQT